MTTERRAVLDEAAAGGPRAKGLDALCTLYRHGFPAVVKHEIQRRASAIMLAADLALRECSGASEIARQLREIKKAAAEMPVLVGNGAGGR